jgi:hypothetical protein
MMAINVGEVPSSRENCMRLRDELWFKGREWFQDRSCSMPRDDALIAELTFAHLYLYLDRQDGAGEQGRHEETRTSLA